MASSKDKNSHGLADASSVVRSRDPMIKRDAPKIIFEELNPVNEEDNQLGLFSDPE